MSKYMKLIFEECLSFLKNQNISDKDYKLLCSKSSKDNNTIIFTIYSCTTNGDPVEISSIYQHFNIKYKDLQLKCLYTNINQAINSFKDHELYQFSYTGLIQKFENIIDGD